MYCAECGEQIAQNPNGSYKRCCQGIGYWVNVGPSDNYKLPYYKGYWLYLNHQKWPKRKQAKLPEVG